MTSVRWLTTADAKGGYSGLVGSVFKACRARTQTLTLTRTLTQTQTQTRARARTRARTSRHAAREP
eukprot:scaffold31137_cov34-Phaeocystis_antarctica.AAC.2